MTDDWPAVRERVADRTDRVLADLRERWDTERTVEPFQYGPRHHDPGEPPETVDGQLELLAGIASVVVFYTDAHEETVLVYNPSGHWEPPGGAIEAGQTPEETVHMEAREETGLEIELTDLLYSGWFEFQYRDGSNVTLPLAQFVGHRVGGSLTVERERIDHPGVTRATGVFDRELLPECREQAEILDLLAD
ncbi:NUDIX hydrolase [Haloarchaeobius baliensis]|uniref:NUDIX hydrolase n=1 Tax=Haloarchaeobius baliensis TaxID=1670458 RepID=UPI003F883166